MRHVEAVVRGRVQGVGFRYSTRRAALRLGVGGWVRNADDGSVELQATAPSETIDEFLEWCRVGPPGAVVTAVEIRSDEMVAGANPSTEFVILR